MKRELQKLSIIIPVYYNEDSLRLLYNDIKVNILDKINYKYEIVMINDGSGDHSWQIMKELSFMDSHVHIISLSKNFGSHAAILCGLSTCTGDCAVVKSADLQEPSELILNMVEQWKNGFNVVLATRTDREEKKEQIFFANIYYWLTRNIALPTMPKGGFDAYLIDRKAIDVLKNLDEKNSSLTGQILWCGFRTTTVSYIRKARTMGKSRWSFPKKIRLVTDTLFSFSLFPIKLITGTGVVAFIGSLIWAFFILMSKLSGHIDVSGWTTSIIIQLLSFGIIMITMGTLGEYLWRTFDASRNRPPYIVEDDEWEKHNDREAL